ncbi:MAG: 50S ribosomal protein L10 [Patescibacteria group bacterium]
MKTKAQKQDSLKEIKEKVARAKVTIFTSFAQAGSKGLNVSGMKELRNSLRPLDAEYSVEKKTIFSRIIEQEIPGSLGVTYGYGDPYAVAKALYQFAKKNPIMQLFGGRMGDTVLDEAMVKEMALMPSKEVLIGRLVGMLSYPMRSLAVVLSQIKHE